MSIELFVYDFIFLCTFYKAISVYKFIMDFYKFIPPFYQRFTTIGFEKRNTLTTFYHQVTTVLPPVDSNKMDFYHFWPPCYHLFTTRGSETERKSYYLLQPFYHYPQKIRNKYHFLLFTTILPPSYHPTKKKKQH